MLEIFFPIRKDNNIYIKQNVLLLYLNGLTLSILLIEVNGKKRIIKNLITDKISLEDLHEDTLEEVLAKKISDNIINLKYDHARIILTGNNSIFKFLILPFSDAEKIKMVVPFELESKLPFSLSECSIDSINVQKGKSDSYQIISALIKQETILKIQEINSISNLNMNSLSLDVIEVIVHHMQKNWEEDHAVVIFTETSINCIFYKKNIIINLRSFDIYDKSANNKYYEEHKNDKKEEVSEVVIKKEEVIKTEETKTETVIIEKKEEKIEEKELSHNSLIKIEEELPILAENITVEKNETQKIEKTTNENVEKEEIKIVKDVKNKKNENLIESIISAFNVVFKQNEIESKNFKIYLIGAELNNFIFEEVSTKIGSSIANYEIYFDKDLEVSFNDDSLKKNITKKNDILIIFSFLYKNSLNFNLAHEEENEYRKDIIKKTLISGIILIFVLFSSIIIFNILRLNKLKNEVKIGEIEAINFLKKEFELQPKNTSSLEKAIKEAENNVIYLENNLPFLASESKYSFLKIFEKISFNLSKEIKDLEIKEMRWKKKENENDILLIQGSVGDWDSLFLLEECLKKTDLFLEVSQAQDLNFSYNLTVINRV